MSISEFAELIQLNNSISPRFFRISHILFKKVELLNFNRFFFNLYEKYIFFQKLCQTKFVDLIEVNKFAF